MYQTFNKQEVIERDKKHAQAINKAVWRILRRFDLVRWTLFIYYPNTTKSKLQVLFLTKFFHLSVLRYGTGTHSRVIKYRYTVCTSMHAI